MKAEDDTGDVDALLALAIVEGRLSDPVASPLRGRAELVAQLENVHKIMTVLDSLGHADAPTRVTPPAATWGPFVLKEQVGRGSYGVVCRAYDPAVAREIAVKLYAGHELPAEPRLIARVRHPNVVTVFGAAVHEGKPGIWMELIHGRTLAERVEKQGPLPCQEVIRIGVDLCGALQAVHEAHLVHQDVKPRNVMEQDDGRIVLMDFGAGLARRPATPPSVSGTPLYMAPEVVLGEMPSAQSDVYSVGVLLYYLLTGTYPAYGADWKELRAFHARSPPPSAATALCQLRPEVSFSLATCVAKAIVRVDKRYGTAAELRTALERADRRDRNRWTFGKRPRWRPPIWIALAVGTALGAAVGVWAKRSPVPARTMVLKRLTWDTDLTTDPTLSADGRLLAYTSDRGGNENLDIWVQQMAGGAPLRVTHDLADDSQPSLSPDGSTVVFRSERDGGGIYVAPILGGAARLIARDAYLPRFSPDGRWIAYLGRRVSSVFTVPLSGGVPRPLPVKLPTIVNGLTWSPDGRYLLFVGIASTGGPDWYAVNVEPGKGVPVIRTDAFSALSRGSIDVLYRWPIPWAWVDNRILFHARLGDTTNLWEVDISPSSLKIGGKPRRLSASTEEQFQPWPGADGNLVFATRIETPYLWQLSIDANRGRARSAPKSLTTYDTVNELHALSPDGRWLAFTSPRAGHSILALMDLNSGIERNLTGSLAPSIERYPVISSDGTKVLYQVAEGDRDTLRVIPMAGGIPEDVCQGCRPTDWTRDKRYVVLQYGIHNHGRLGVLDLQSGQQSAILAHKAKQIYRGHLSPDNAWIAFHVTTTHGPTQEFIAPFRGMVPILESEWIAITDGQAVTDAPRWSPDGNLLYYISEIDSFRCIWAQRLDPPTKIPLGQAIPVQHFHSRKRSITNIDIRAMDLSVARDKLVFNMGELTGNIWMAEFR